MFEAQMRQGRKQMSNLEKIQKIYNVFRIIAMIAMIFSFIFAGTNLIGLIAAVVLRDSRFFVELGNLAGSVEITGSIQIIANAITGIVTGVTNGLLSLFSMNYFASAKTDGTPFTKTGATTLRNLGIKTIAMPLVAIIVNAIILGCFGVASLYDIGNGTSVATGIFMLIFSVILAYGSELEEKANRL